MPILKYTDDAVIIGNIAADADSENYLHLGEIKSSVQLQWLTAKPNQDKCDAFHHPVQNPNFEQLSLNGRVITPSTRLNYLSPAMENRLCYETQIAHKVSSAKQRLQLVISTNLCERDSKSIRCIYITGVLTLLSKTEWTHLLATYKRTNTKPLHLFLYSIT